MNPSRRPLAIALAASAFYAGVFVTAAHAEMHYVRVTLVTGQQLTITVEVPPGTPVDQIQIPGLPAAVVLDRGPRLDRDDADAHRDAGADGHGDADRDGHAHGDRHAREPEGRHGQDEGQGDDKVDKTKKKVEETTDDAANKATGGGSTPSR